MADTTDKETPGKFSDHGKSAMIFDESVLMITYDGMVKDQPLPENKVTEALAAENKLHNNRTNYSLSKDISVVVKSGENSQKFIDIQSISGMGMDREYEVKYSGGNGAYAVNLPGRMTYQDVTITHLFTRDTFFLKWLRNGAMKGGASRADIEIRVKDSWKIGGNILDFRTMTFTLHDAFPIKWELSEALNKNASEKLIMENVTLAYSRMTFKNSTLTIPNII